MSSLSSRALRCTAAKPSSVSQDGRDLLLRLRHFAMMSRSSAVYLLAGTGAYLPRRMRMTSAP